jgi:PAS domain S-box-containing protein
LGERNSQVEFRLVKIKSVSLKQRIAMLVFVLASLMISIVAAITILSYKSNKEKFMIQQSTIMADLLSDLSAISLINKDSFLEPYRVLEKLRNYTGVSQCIIYDNTEKIIAKYFIEPSINLYSETVYKDTLFFRPDRLIIFEPITYNNENLGTLLLIENTDELYLNVLIFATKTGFIALLLITLSFLIAKNLKKNLADPLQKLLETAESNSQFTDFNTRIEKQNLDEMGRLFHSFIALLRHLEISKEEKKNLKQKTEAIIQELEASRGEIIDLMHSLASEVEDKNNALKILEETRLRLDLAVSGSNDGLWDWKDLNDDKQWWSPRFYQLLNYHEQTMKSTRNNFVKLIHPADINKEMELFKDHLENNTPYNIRLRLLNQNKEYRWFHLRGQALWDEYHNPVRMAGSLHDIHEQQKLKEQSNFHIRELEIISNLTFRLNKSENTSEICELLGNEIFILNPETYLLITLSDPQTQKLKIKCLKGFDPYLPELNKILGLELTNIEPEPIDYNPETSDTNLRQLPNNICDFFGAALPLTVCRLFTRFLGVETTWHINFKINNSHSCGVTILAKTAEPLHHKKVIETITSFSSIVIERINTQIQLKREQEFLNLAVESTELATWELNIATGKISGNDYMFTIPGYKPFFKEITFEYWKKLAHPDDINRILQAIDDHFQGKTKNYKAEYRIKTQSGNWKWVRAQGKVVQKDKNNKPLRMIGSFIDIDDSKKREMEFKKLNEELEERVYARTAELEKSYNELEEFSYTISHDLRTPLRAIGGYAEILLEEQKSELNYDGVQLLEMIGSNIRFMGNLIDDLLQYVRLSRLTSDMAEVDLGLIAWNAYRHLQIGEKKKDIDLIISDLKNVTGDAAQLKLAFTHLLENAVKYRHPNRKLKIVIGRQKKEDVFFYYVQDNGIGFNMDYAQHIFQIFHRLHTIDKYEGTGVGLALVKRIIEKHGGEIFARSEPDMGTTFWFSLPESAREKNIT